MPSVAVSLTVTTFLAHINNRSTFIKDALCAGDDARLSTCVPLTSLRVFQNSVTTLTRERTDISDLNRTLQTSEKSRRDLNPGL